MQKLSDILNEIQNSKNPIITQPVEERHIQVYSTPKRNPLDIQLTKGQEQALSEVIQWFKTKHTPLYRLGGCAGSGKSSLVPFIQQALNLSDSEIAICAFTGKAATVLQSKGINATTIHKLIYEFVAEDGSKKLVFRKKDFLDRSIKLILVDEASMISKKIYKDLSSFNVPILMVGDNNQLPPVGEDMALMHNPDFELTEIMRQVADSPIIQLSQMILNGFVPRQEGNIGKNILFRKQADIPDSSLLNASQILVGTNNSRTMMNNYIRSILGYTGQLPQKGEKVINLRNLWNVFCDNQPIINGTVGKVINIRHLPPSEPYFQMLFQPIDSDEQCVLSVDKNPFLGLEPTRHKFTLAQIDFAYAATVHKWQGSSAKNIVLLLDWKHPATFKRWFYTAVTRAEENLIIGI